MKQDSHISVAMCTYNGSRFLPEQLASIAAQTRLPNELVICDDGSTDSTPEIVAEFARTVNFPVRLFRNPQNLGCTKNFEQAIGLCTGDLIALCDQDDIWMPEKLARQAEMMERDPELGGTFSDAELVNDASQPIGRRLWQEHRFTEPKQDLFRSGNAARILLERSVVLGATLMIRSTVRPLCEDIPNPWIHDAWIAWMIALYSKLGFTSDPLIRYRLHGKQLTGIEELIHPLTLHQRLLRDRREQPTKCLARSRELEVLFQRLATKPDKESQAVLPQLRNAIRFFSDGGSPYTTKISRAVPIMRNTRNYHRYENGWKSFVRDLVLMVVSR